VTRLLRLIFLALPATLADIGVRLRPISEALGLALLVLLGLHGAADLLDDILFGAVDGLDRLLDAAISALLAWLGGAEILKPQTAAAWSDSFTLLLDIDRKEAVAVVLALATEVLIDLALVWWCLPAGRGPVIPASGETARAQGARQHLRAAREAVKRRGPGSLRALALVLAFSLGAFALGRFAAGYVALWVAGPIFGPNAGLLAKMGGVLMAGLALAVLVPIALRRASARSLAMMWTGPLRSLLFPLAVTVLLAGAIISGGPARALRALLGGDA